MAPTTPLQASIGQSSKAKVEADVESVASSDHDEEVQELKNRLKELDSDMQDYGQMFATADEKFGEQGMLLSEQATKLAQQDAIIRQQQDAIKKLEEHLTQMSDQMTRLADNAPMGRLTPESPQ